MTLSVRIDNPPTTHTFLSFFLLSQKTWGWVSRPGGRKRVERIGPLHNSNPPSPPPHARGAHCLDWHHHTHEGPAWTGNQGKALFPASGVSSHALSLIFRTPVVHFLSVEPHPSEYLHVTGLTLTHIPHLSKAPHLPLQELSQLGSGCRGFADKLLSTCPHLPALSPLLPPELTLILFIFPLKSLLWSRNQLCRFQLPDFKGRLSNFSPSKGTVEG